MDENTKGKIQNLKKVNTRVIFGVVTVFALIILGIYLYSTNQINKSHNQSNNDNGSQLRIYTYSEVAKNNSKSSCWTVIDNNVYNITDFISKHKGGDKILAVCGIDGTDLFTGRSPMGRVHSEMAKALLSRMQIGRLQN